MKGNLDVEFTKLENKVIGRNISMYRKIREIKAFNIAEQLGLKEAAYSKYERGETAITVDFVQKVAQIINIDPIQMMTVSPGHMINPSMAIQTDSSFRSRDEKQNEAILTLINSQIEMNKKIMELLEKK
ncbi:transcriptional regulator with XRE-family HTH domain [Pedobacter sp. AK017]|uniref:helix-turn-helix domain-containing protein n=1 Tax=Pedobacter sp. AK017 TaxID=2723073 RepID=UPI00161DFAFF|nr:helix-turn-helix transcriptional regulator [Pedobacter sp. AK017]MBB5437731.1 transcriptional regulator with XRE-family HTH domain [Pedobacter sp. AK017]